MAVGIFWTRLGTRTEAAQSGAVEELDRLAKAGRRIMLYFSERRVPLSRLDAEQVGRLAEFKKTTSYPHGIVETFKSPQDYREKLTRQLSMAVNDVLRQAPPVAHSEGEGPSVSLYIGSGDPPAATAATAIDLCSVTCSDFDSIPDYETPEKRKQALLSQSAVSVTYLGTPLPVASSDNKDYYRDLVQWYIQRLQYIALRLYLKNSGGQGISAVHVETTIRGTSSALRLLGPSELLTFPSEYSASYFRTTSGLEPIAPGSFWFSAASEVQLDWEVIQPGRTLVSKNYLYLASTESCVVNVETLMFSFSAPPTVLPPQRIELNVSESQLTFQDIITAVAELVRPLEVTVPSLPEGS